MWLLPTNVGTGVQNEVVTRKFTHAEASAIMKAANLEPLEPYTSSGTPWKNKCLTCKKISKPTLGSVRSGSGGCVACGIKKRAQSKKLDTQVVTNLMLKRGFKPLEPYTTARSRWKCECLTCHRIAYPSYWNMKNSTTLKKGCSVCLGLTVDPVEVKEKMLHAGLKTIGPYPGKDNPWKSKCLTCGNIVYPSWNNIRNGNGGCGKCRYVKSGKSNRTPEKNAIAKMAKAGLLPLEPYVSQFIPWKSQCLKCMNLTYPMYANIKKGQGGCSFCRETGLNYKDPAYIYLIFHSDFQSIKIGISNNDSRPNRLKAHQKNGWEVYKVKNFSTGQQAEFVETQVLRWIRRELGLGRHLPPRFMPQGGHTETIDSNEVDMSTIWAKVIKVSKLRK